MDQQLRKALFLAETGFENCRLLRLDVRLQFRFLGLEGSRYRGLNGEVA